MGEMVCIMNLPRKVLGVAWRLKKQFLAALVAVVRVLESLPIDHPGATGASRSSSPTTGEMEFTDKPNFTVAGVMDWNNTGTHGSDVRVRTSEALAKETLALKNGGLAKSSTVETKAGAARTSDES